MIIKYKIDQKIDNKVIWAILGCNDPAGLGDRATSMNILLEFAIKISQSSKYFFIKKDIEEFSNKRYQKVGENFMKKQTIMYQEEWNKINEIFMKEIPNITNFEWRHKVFYVILSPFHIGTTSKGGNVITRSILEDPKSQTRITAHEVLMSHLWSYFCDNFSEAKNDIQMTFWKLNEITTTLILGTEPVLNDLWVQNQKGIENFLLNYSQLNFLKYKLNNLYLKKFSFDQYINQALEVLKT